MSKVDIIKQKYSSKINVRTFNALNAGDTTPTKKYLDYMCKVRPYFGTSRAVIETVFKFDSLLPYITNKDIYSSEYDDPGHLMSVISEAESLKSDKLFIKEDNVEVLIENDEYILLSPKTFIGSLKYGANTRWCTASKTRPSYFDKHVKDGYLYYLIRKNEKMNNWDKMAFYQTKANSVLGEVTIFNSNDTPLSGHSIFKNLDWEVSEFMNILFTIKSNIAQKEYLSNSKEIIEQTIRSLERIDIEKLQRSLNVVNSNGLSKENFKDKLTSVIDNLNSALTK